MSVEIVLFQGNEHQKPMLMGATVDEAMSYVAGAFANPMNDTIYRLAMTVVFKDKAQKVLEHYPSVVIR